MRRIARNEFVSGGSVVCAAAGATLQAAIPVLTYRSFAELDAEYTRQHAVR
jgi:hypothetical protein